MSDPVFTNADRSPSLSTGGHDTGLYDPDRHDNRIVAVYETTERANMARDLVVQAGVPESDLQVLDQADADPTTPAGDSTDQGGLWSSLVSLFVPAEDAHGYAEGVRRGHAVLSVDPSRASDRHRVIAVLESTDPIDFDARLEEWRQAGYSSPDSSAVGMTTPAPAVDVAQSPGPGEEAAERARIGQREAAPGARRVRSYVSDRPDTAPADGQTTTATSGATTSGANAPRPSRP